MKTKQAKEESDKSIDEDAAVEPKTRARKKASDVAEEEKNKVSQDEPKTSKEYKKPGPKPKALIKKKPLGIRKTLRSKKTTLVKETVKKVIKQGAKRGRKPRIKIEPENSQEKDTVPLIPASEIKKEPIDDALPNDTLSRSSSPRTTGSGRRQRLSSDIVMMKSMLADSLSNFVIGSRTSPYLMRSERSNSPSTFEGKSLRSRKPRKVKNNLLNEVVMKQQKKRRRLLSDSKIAEGMEANEDCKKLKRGRSSSRDGSEISKCSDITESDLSLSESLNDTDSKELNKNIDKPKTELDIDIENNVQISTNEKVPSPNVDSKLTEINQDTGPSCNINEKSKKSLSLKRSTSLDSDNNNSNRIKIDKLNSSDIEDKSPMKTENDTLFEARSSILTSMSKTFNSRKVAKNIRRARRGRRATAATRPSPGQARSTVNTAATSGSTEEKQETLESLSKEIDDLINNLDQNIDRDKNKISTCQNRVSERTNDTNSVENTLDQIQAKPKLYSQSKPLGDNNSIVNPETPIKDNKDSNTTESTPSKTDDSENIRLVYEEDSVEKSIGSPKQGVTYKCSTVASIDKLMDRLKEFEEFDKRRQRLESESKSCDNKSVMVTNDVVLIPKSGADIKLKDIQTVRSPERPIEKENVLSCFENNSAISIVKRDQVRRSIDIDLPNSVTLIKRNSFSARKESTSSNHSKESDAISIFEKSLGKDVTLTEIRKSVDKPPATQVDLHQFATLLPNNPTQALIGVVLDTSQISILPRTVTSEIQITKRSSRDSLSRKSSESGNDIDDKIATIEKIMPPLIKSSEISITPAPVAVKSPETIQPMETEALEPPLDDVNTIPEDIVAITKAAPEITEVLTDLKPTESSDKMEVLPDTATEITPDIAKEIIPETKVESKVIVEPAEPQKDDVEPRADDAEPTKDDIEPKIDDTEPKKEDAEPEKDEEAETKKEDAEPEKKDEEQKGSKEEKMDLLKYIEMLEEELPKTEKKESDTEVKRPEPAPTRSPKEKGKSARNSVESQPGPSNILQETPESQKRKENVLKTLGLLTHKAAKEATIEKLKERERIYGMMNKNKAVKSGSGDYTGTLKTVIKLNRHAGGEREKKRVRSSLKMTFQKSKSRGKLGPDLGEEAAKDEAYYTIERREGAAAGASDGGHRKSYSNRVNNHEEAVPEPVEPKETLNLVIPEKASSFSIHPGRLCMDQCFYCGGKFGLFDTPCHIAQMKSADRQKKVLDNEEKLAIDSCLCDACYRHVDRRANCPSYRKKPPGAVKTPGAPPAVHSANTSEKGVSPPLEEESEEEPSPAAGGRPAICHTEGCTAPADHSIRRKWLIKMRSSVNKLLKLEGDYPGLHTIPLCGLHWRALAPLLACGLCRRRLSKHDKVHLLHNYEEVNPLLSQAGVPVTLMERGVVCKLCRYYCVLLTRGAPDHNVRLYTRRLLELYNVEVPPELEQEPEVTPNEDPNITKSKKKQRLKSKQRKSTDPDKPSDSCSSEKTESSPEKEKKEDTKEIQDTKVVQDTKVIQDTKETQDTTQPQIEEDIESLISSNKIPVPGAKQTEVPQSDNSETENLEYDMPTLPIDKQTELQYLLQKQNNPAQFLKQPNLLHKQKGMKLHLSGIQKHNQQQRIHDKNTKRLQKIGQIVVKERSESEESDKIKDGTSLLKNLTLNEECTIESIPNKKPADINTLKNKWQMSESFTQVKKNLSELSKKLTIEKDPKKVAEAKFSNPVKRLETNPSISVRELFPGEEEMNLQCNIEFNNVKCMTPEGWEKCNTTIQYDSETKRLWNELQRPYGNQSSFLRHLILLEKYFRNGDLVLSQNATPYAANYSDSVQSRLRAYDNIASDAPRRSEPAISLIEYRKKPAVNGKSLLKTSQSDVEKEPKKTMPPPMPKPNKIKDKKTKQVPPELIAINTPNAQGRKAIQNVLHNIQQLVKGVSASDPTEIAAAPLPVPVPKFEPPKEKEKEKKEPKETSKDTPKKTKPTSKPWRPTLMPITPENEARIAREPKQIAVDGRSLPSLVQVMSSGQRYHITLQDYNKMCIMRREKLQQLQDGDKTKKDDTTVVTEIQPSTTHGNGGSVMQNIPAEKEERKEMPELKQITSNAATILKNVGLKNITIAPIPPKTATVTSAMPASPSITSPSLMVTSTPIRLPQLPSVSITSETVLTPTLPLMSSSMIMPKIPKSLTVIPQTITQSNAQSIVVPQSMSLTQAMMVHQSMVVPQAVAVPQGMVVPQMLVPTTQVMVSSEGPRP